MEFLTDYGIFLLKVITIALGYNDTYINNNWFFQSKTPTKGSFGGKESF